MHLHAGLPAGRVQFDRYYAPGVAFEFQGPQHYGRLEHSRSICLDAFRGMTLDDWRRLRSFGGDADEVTPEWVVFHLVEHEAGHAYQMSAIKRRARRFVGGG